MSVMVVTSLGDIVVDLHTDRCPLTTKNFLKLCKIKYFNGCLFHEVRKDFTAQTGDPTGKGTGGDSIYKFLYGDQARFFGDEIHPDLKHSKTGTVAMAPGGENLNASQFYFTLRDDLDYLDGKHTVFGEVAEGLDTLTRINEAYVDDKGRPYKNIRIKHTYILDDPFDDPPQLAELIPNASPEGKPRDEVDDDVRLEDDWVPMDEQLGPAELEEVLRLKQAHSSAVVLESIGDIPDAEIKPPENVLFVCKLNPVTEDEDLHTIFSRFGTVVSADIIRDFKTGDSLCYAFIEFETNEACEQAYFKMDNALIDDRRIHVDFSQSVSKLWSQFRRKEHQKDNGKGCFKCGAFDHIAKDCTEGSAKMPPPKFTIKDHDQQRGGHANSSYEMVFDENAPLNTEQGKRSSERENEDQKGKERMEHMGDMKRRDGEKRDTRLDEDGEGERRRDYREEDRKKGREGRTRDEDYHGERGKGSSKRHGGGYRGGRGEGDYRHEERRDERGYRKTEGHGDRRSDRDYRRGGHDSYEVGRDSRNRSGDDRDSRKRSADDRDGDSRKRSTTDRDYSRKLSTEDDSRRRSSDMDYSRKSSTDDDSRKRSSTDRDDYRKLSTDDDSRKRSTDRDSRKLSTDDDRRSDRRHRDGR